MWFQNTREFFSQAKLFFLNFYQQKSNLNVNYSYITFQKEILKSFCHLACVLWVCILNLSSFKEERHLPNTHVSFLCILIGCNTCITALLEACSDCRLSNNFIDGGLLSQCICMSVHHVHFKYLTVLFVNYALIQLGKKSVLFKLIEGL